MQTEMSSSPAGGLRLPAGKHTSILTDFQTIVNKKITKKELFLATFAAKSTDLEGKKAGISASGGTCFGCAAFISYCEKVKRKKQRGVIGPFTD